MRSGKTPQGKSGLLFTEEAELKPTESAVFFRSGHLTRYLLIFVNRCMEETINPCSDGGYFLKYESGVRKNVTNIPT